MFFSSLLHSHYLAHHATLPSGGVKRCMTSQIMAVKKTSFFLGVIKYFADIKGVQASGISM